MVSTTIFQNITEKLEKMTYFVIWCYMQGVICKVLYAAHRYEKVL